MKNLVAVHYNIYCLKYTRYTKLKGTIIKRDIKFMTKRGKSKKTTLFYKSKLFDYSKIK